MLSFIFCLFPFSKSCLLLIVCLFDELIIRQSHASLGKKNLVFFWGLLMIKHSVLLMYFIRFSFILLCI